MASRFLQFLHLLALFSFLPFSFSRLIESRFKVSNAERLVLLRERTQTVRFNPSKSKQISWHPSMKNSGYYLLVYKENGVQFTKKNRPNFIPFLSDNHDFFLLQARVSLYEGFLSDDECEHLISLAHGKVEIPLVIDNNSTGTQRTIPSGKKYLVNSEKDEILSKIEERISLWTMLPKEHGGGIQIWNYRVDDSYGPHYDFYENNEAKLGGNRVATVLMYLSNVTHGGETVFLKSQTKNSKLEVESLSECASAGYAIKPVKGNAVFFFNLNLDSTPDNSSLHEVCKVLEGEKWSATMYLHMGPIHQRELTPALTLPIDQDECTDEDDNCESWAKLGECERNPIFMLGSSDYSGACRKSCKVC